MSSMTGTSGMSHGHGHGQNDTYWALAGLRIRHRFYHSFFSTQHSTIQKLSLKNALVRLSAVLAPKQSDDHTYTVGTCLLLVCFSIQSIFYRSKDGGDFVFHKPIWRLIGLLWETDWIFVWDWRSKTLEDKSGSTCACLTCFLYAMHIKNLTHSDFPVSLDQ